MLNAKNQFLPNQNGEEQEWHRYSEEKPPMVKSQTSRARRQEPNTKSQTPRARHQEPHAKSQMPKLHGKSEKSQIQMGHPWNQYLTSRHSLLMIF